MATPKGNPWYGRNAGSVKCPYPGCGHIGTVITKIHCRNEHGLEREELGELHGVPAQIGRAAFRFGEGKPKEDEG